MTLKNESLGVRCIEAFSFIPFHEPSVAKYGRADRRQWAFFVPFFTFLVLNLQCFSIYKA